MECQRRLRLVPGVLDEEQGPSYSHIGGHTVQLGRAVRASAHTGKRRVDPQAGQRAEA